MVRDIEEELFLSLEKYYGRPKKTLKKYIKENIDMSVVYVDI
tara:strand:+ start:148 stop:273 length:126 start_codon:yes stop_codon:yes gene_type:complete